jgi:hypothetical protein
MSANKGVGKIAKALGVTLHDAGREIEGPTEVGPPERDRIMKPDLRLDVQQLPDLKGKNVGDKVTLVAQGNIIGHDMHESGKSKPRNNYEIEIDRIGLKTIVQALKG